MGSSRDHERFQQVLSQYDTAESFIKAVEARQSGVSLPAVNQLRYAGHHLLRGLANENDEVYEKGLNDAVDHCQRAMYEASEAGIIYYLDLLKAFGEDYSEIPLGDAAPVHMRAKKLAGEVVNTLSQGRLNRESAEHQASEYMGMFEKLSEVVEDLELHRDELDKVLRSHAQEARRFLLQTAFWIVMPIIAVAGVLVTILCC
ncbi:MAG: hypothetical protein OXC19_10105 [Bryobacterales bacterium]|nr:hypothetical protein [Bryobacterales bacterium]